MEPSWETLDMFLNIYFLNIESFHKIYFITSVEKAFILIYLKKLNVKVDKGKEI